MNKPRVTTFKSMAKRMKVQKKKQGKAKTTTEQEQKDFDDRFEQMKEVGYWGYDI